ncbi:plasmid partitioning protein RepB C-terminal domain-containing protein [Cupriavidus basilensis]|uniref:ParB N-terminal domain-containing protein n=1 Tax=Cupriavidus basilensis TaxID=68895 RepID=A0A643FX94_9BURK|nr:plasmid partitioning protein RepB C-terminal domain-containing protein [Cupriavidus basilensis]QOT76565.1 ParB N-terminal domain-containing protein [Cupriavidus basilensis]
MEKEKRNKPIALGFETTWIDIPVSNLRPTKNVPVSIKDTAKYRQIRSSVKAIGLVEPLVVIPSVGQAGCFSILDGHLRAEALRELGIERAPCLISTDDEAYTYNKCVSRLASIQEHKMVVLAFERGASVELLSEALGISVQAIRQRFKMLDGICDEAISVLADKPVPHGAFKILRQMQAFRQIDVANAMVNLSNFSIRFAEAMLESTPVELLNVGARKKVEATSSTEAVQRLERELAVLHDDTKLLEETYGPDNLRLVVIRRYIEGLLNNAKVVRWLAQYRRDYLQQLQILADSDRPSRAKSVA